MVEHQLEPDRIDRLELRVDGRVVDEFDCSKPKLSKTRSQFAIIDSVMVRAGEDASLDAQRVKSVALLVYETVGAVGHSVDFLMACSDDIEEEFGLVDSAVAEAFVCFDIIVSFVSQAQSSPESQLLSA